MNGIENVKAELEKMNDFEIAHAEKLAVEAIAITLAGSATINPK